MASSLQSSGVEMDEIAATTIENNGYLNIDALQNESELGATFMAS